MQAENPITLSWLARFLSETEHACPSLSVSVVGRSLLCAPLLLARVGSGAQHLLYVAAHHATEWIGSYILCDFLENLCRAATQRRTCYGINVDYCLQSYTFWVLPLVNPDGVALATGTAKDSPLSERQRRMSGGDFSHWQSNARGVDLNHNYDAGFGTYKVYEARNGIVPGATRYSGEYPESEPESRTIATLVRTLAPAAVVSLHTQGEEIYSGGHTGRHVRIAGRLAAVSGYRYAVPEGAAAYGGLCDYSGGVLGIPSFTIEAGKGKNPLPLTDLPLLCGRLRPALFSLPLFL